MMRSTLLSCLIVLCLSAFACDDDVKGVGDDAIDLRSGDGQTQVDSSQDAPGDSASDTHVADSKPTDVTSCDAGTFVGCADEHTINVCRADGSGVDPTPCPGTQNCLGGACTDMKCLPNTQTCEGTSQFKLCKADGSDYAAATDCPIGTLCQDSSCRTLCEFGKYRSSYVGCEYWTVDLDNYHDPTSNPKPDEVPHSVVISNPSSTPAVIAFSSQAASIAVTDPVIPGNSARVFQMPRLDVDGSQISDRTIRILSTTPVAAYQFNPFDDSNVYSNGSSLLLPVNVLGTDYIVVGWPTAPLPCLPMLCPDPQHAYTTIIATSFGTTTVQVTTTARIDAGDGVDALAPGSTGTYNLTQGQVLNLQAFDVNFNGPNDPTGTIVHASQPVAVFSGHEEAVIGEVGEDACCAEHLEQQLFPLDSWSTHYLGALSPGRGIKKDLWRIVAGADGVTITTQPPQPNANNVTLNRGQFVEFFTAESFEVDATGIIEVAQFLVGQSQTEDFIGDPEFVLAVPTERFRSDYTVMTPSGYNEDWLSIMRRPNAVVHLDGAPVTTTFVPIGSGAWEAGAVRVSAGVHTLLAPNGEPFGLSAFGYGSAVSYGYPGGLNLVGSATP